MWLLRILPIIFSFTSCISMASAESFWINYADKVTIPDEIGMVILSPYAEVKGDKNKVYAYISLTELSRNSPLIKQLPKESIAAENTTWSSYLVYINHPIWHRIIEQELDWILQQGYQHLFIDTIDGIETLCQKNSDKCDDYRSHALELIQLMRKRIPGNFIANRGFSIYPGMKENIQGVLIESFFYGKKGDHYEQRTKNEMEWLSTWVKRLQDDNKFILAVDYAENLSPAKYADLKEKSNEIDITWGINNELLQY